MLTRIVIPTTNEVPWTKTGYPSSTGLTSDAINIGSMGVEAAFVVSGTTASQIVTYQLSPDGNSWYNPCNSVAATNYGVFGRSFTTSLYFIFEPKVAQYIRFVAASPSVANTITATFIQQEEIA